MNGLIRNLRYDLPLHLVLAFTNWLPDNVPFLRFRGALASVFFGKCGANLRLGRNLTFYNPSRIAIGSDVYIAIGCWFMAAESIDIEDEVMFGPYCIVVSGEHTRHGGSYRRGGVIAGATRIGRGSWLAGHVTVTAGRDVGPGALVAAGAVVTRSIPADAVVAGNPARIVGEARDE